jgi:protease I
MAETKTIGILVEKEYEDLELWYPKLRLTEAGHEVLVIGGGEKSYTGKKGYPVEPDRAIGDVRASDLDALVIPGGWAPDFMRRDRRFADLVRAIGEAGKPVAAICHGGWMLVSAGLAKGRTVTAFHSIKDDLVAAGATFVDEEVHVDGNVVTSRKPADLPAFCRELLKLIESAQPALSASGGQDRGARTGRTR